MLNEDSWFVMFSHLNLRNAFPIGLTCHWQVRLSSREWTSSTCQKQKNMEGKRKDPPIVDSFVKQLTGSAHCGGP